MQLTTLIMFVYFSRTNPPAANEEVQVQSRTGKRRWTFVFLSLDWDVVNFEWCRSHMKCLKKTKQKHLTHTIHLDKKVTSERLEGDLAVWPERFLQTNLRGGDVGLTGDGGVWILAPSLTVILAARSAVRHILRKRQGEGWKGIVNQDHRERKPRKRQRLFQQREHISRPGARFGQGDVCSPRGTTTFHQNTAKMLFRQFVLLSCQ